MRCFVNTFYILFVMLMPASVLPHTPFNIIHNPQPTNSSSTPWRSSPRWWACTPASSPCPTGASPPSPFHPCPVYDMFVPTHVSYSTIPPHTPTHTTQKHKQAREARPPRYRLHQLLPLHPPQVNFPPFFLGSGFRVAMGRGGAWMGLLLGRAYRPPGAFRVRGGMAGWG